MPGDRESPRTALVLNIASGKGEKQAEEARQALRDAGVVVDAFHGIRDPATLPATVRRALDEGYTRIILGGGDGSVNCSVDELVRTKAVLGVLPLGTANDFARTLGIPPDLAGACAVIAGGREALIDLGVVSGTHYVNVVTIGLGAEVAKRVSRRLKRIIGSLAYPVTAMNVLRRHRPFGATITFPDGEHPPATFERLIQIAIGNGRFYGGGAVVAPEAQINDGLLDIYAIEMRSWRQLLGAVWHLRSGRQVQRPDVPYWRAHSVQIETHPRTQMNLDGEPGDHTPARFAVESQALRVFVPAEFLAGTDQQTSQERSQAAGNARLRSVR